MRTPLRPVLLLLALLAALLAPRTAWATVWARLAEGVTRCDVSEEARADALPSLSFADPRTRETWQAMAERPRITPRFRTNPDGSTTASIQVPPGAALYGTGMAAGPIERSGRRTVAWNTDAYNYTDKSESLYQSHPWVLVVRSNGTAFGVLADTTYRCAIDLTSGIRFRAEGPAFPVIAFEGDSPQQVLTRLTDFIGRIDLPPRWTLGYHQCRYSYFPDTRAQEVAREFRARSIPCDVIWHDIHYMDGNVNFTFDPERFPDPKAHNAVLHGMHFKSVWMINTGQGIREGFFVHDQMRDQELFVRDKDGNPYIGNVWPGPCLFPDFTSARVRAWWAGLFKDFMALGIDGIWNDMNEPAVFDTPKWTMPEDNLHDADPELGGPGPHARYHNVYGMLMARATREGILAANPDKRPFVLTRANFIGGHRYAAMWTGDNAATLPHIDWSVSMAITLGLSGQPFAGPDIGGFKGPIDGPEFARWMGIGALLPFARGHTEVDAIDKEPWAFGPEVEAICRMALERRSQLLPHLYTAFRRASIDGIPVVRPLLFADPRDHRLREVDDGFLLGDGLAVWCQVRPDERTKPVLPKGTWRPLTSLAGADHPELPALFVRTGAIVPTGPILQYDSEKPLDPLTLHVCLDADGRATGTLYEDDGDGFDYRTGDYLLTTYEARRAGDAVEISITSTEGDRPRPERALVVRILTERGDIEAIGRDGHPLTIPLPAPGGSTP